MKRLPISSFTFEKIIENDWLYVDKTQQIYGLLQFGDFIFFARPRRFGKSLLTSTLANLFEGKRTLFSGLWIEDKIDWKVYSVIQLSFGQITHSLSRSVFDQSGIGVLEEIARKYQVEINALTFSDYLDRLISKLAEKTGERVVLLIDECDKPITDHLTNPEIAERNRTWLREVFEKIKAQEGKLKFFLFDGDFQICKNVYFLRIE